jgi:hypothetical protein
LCGKKERGEIRERRRKKIKGDPHTTHMYTHASPIRAYRDESNTTKEGGIPPPYDVARAT